MPKDLSVIVPMYNEEESAEYCYAELTKVLKASKKTYEIIFINDGSKDGTLQILSGICSKDKNIKVISLSKNFGQQPALLAGFKEACGKAVINIDADLQDPPSAILEMVKKWEEGFDIVIGKRKKRKGESLFKKLTAKLYGRFLKRLTNLDFPLNEGDFRLFDRKVVEVIKQMPEHNRFLRGMSAWVGFKKTEVLFDREQRKFGKTKYNLKKLAATAVNGVVANTNKPLYMAFNITFCLVLLGFAGFITLTILAICNVAFYSWLWLLPSMLICTSVITLCLGIIGLYLGRVYDEAKQRPIYIIDQKINFEE